MGVSLPFVLREKSCTLDSKQVEETPYYMYNSSIIEMRDDVSATSAKRKKKGGREVCVFARSLSSLPGRCGAE